MSPTRLLILAAAAFGLLSAPTAVAGADNCAFGSDAGDVHVFASLLPGSVYCTGTLDATDVSDWYVVEIPSGALTASIYVEVCPLSGSLGWDPDVNLYFVTGGLLGVGSVSAPGRLVDSSAEIPPDCDVVQYTAGTLEFPGGGEWYIQVYRYAGSGTYDLWVN